MSKAPFAVRKRGTQYAVVDTRVRPAQQRGELWPNLAAATAAAADENQRAAITTTNGS